MAHQPQYPRLTPALQKILCVLMCCATWRGPVVWVHQHPVAIASTWSDIPLIEHVSVFHHNAASAIGAREWHLHIGQLSDLLRDGHDDCDPSDTRAPDHLEIVVDISAHHGSGLNDGVCGDVSPAITFANSAHAIAGHVTCDRSRPFLQTFATQQLRALISVRLC